MAVIGKSVLTVTECVSVIAAEATMQSALVDAFAVGYGISSTAIGIGLILMGCRRPANQHVAPAGPAEAWRDSAEKIDVVGASAFAQTALTTTPPVPGTVFVTEELRRAARRVGSPQPRIAVSG